MSQQRSRKNKVAKCEFCMTKNQVSEMRQDLHQRHPSDDKDRPVYFCSECCSFMHSYESGNNIFSGKTHVESHKQYVETLKKCYPSMYNARHGKQEQ